MPLAPISCAPIGMPPRSTPHGRDSPGSPAKLTGTVKMSERYMLMLSLRLAPNLGAVDGATGQISASQRPNTSPNSAMMRLRTFRAFL